MGGGSRFSKLLSGVGWAKNKIVGGGSKVGGSKIVGGGAKKFLVMFPKMHHFKEKIGNFSKIFACDGKCYALQKFIYLF